MFNIFYAAADGPSPFIMPLVIMVAFGAMYFFTIRPQKKKEQALKKEREGMKVGDRVVTVGGIVGNVVNIKDNEVTISTGVANTLIAFRKESIGTVLKD